MKTKTYNYKINTIAYDLGSEWKGFNKPVLPDCLIIENVPKEVADSPIELEAYLADKISDHTGFCVEHFFFSVIK
jgi:hypothetical protein